MLICRIGFLFCRSGALALCRLPLSNPPTRQKRQMSFCRIGAFFVVLARWRFGAPPTLQNDKIRAPTQHFRTCQYDNITLTFVDLATLNCRVGALIVSFWWVGGSPKSQQYRTTKRVPIRQNRRSGVKVKAPTRGRNQPRYVGMNF